MCIRDRICGRRREEEEEEEGYEDVRRKSERKKHSENSIVVIPVSEITTHLQAHKFLVCGSETFVKSKK